MRKSTLLLAAFFVLVSVFLIPVNFSLADRSDSSNSTLDIFSSLVNSLSSIVRTLASSVALLVSSDTQLAQVGGSGNVTFEDTFDSGFLQNGWTWNDPRGNSGQSISAGHLEIFITSTNEHDCYGTTRNCPTLLRNINPGDKIFEAKIDGDALTQAYQAYGIMLEQDANNYLRFEFRSNSVGVFAPAWKILSGVGSSAIAEKAVSLGSANNYLRLTRSGDTYTLDYSQDGSSYTSAGSFTLSGFAPAKAGLYVINAGSNSQTTAKFDYFKISGSVAARQDGVCGETRNSCNPGTFIDVDDSLTQYLWTCNGNGVGGATNDPCSLTIPVNPLTYTLSTPTPSNGSISKSPNQTTFNQDDRVTLTATPNSGYRFGSWSGDASGTVNPLDIIMNGNKSITAIFTQIVTTPSGNTFYIRNGATSSSCTDWTNACDSLPGTLQRGATYYIADGSYGSYTFDDPVFGTQLITIKKATASDHGTNTGWSSSYGSGQAVFGGTLNFNTSYWVFDGQTGGGPGSWKTGHGFKIEVLTTESGMGISVERNMHDITLKRFEVQGNGGDGGGSGTPNDAVVLKDNGYNINIS